MIRAALERLEAEAMIGKDNETLEIVHKAWLEYEQLRDMLNGSNLPSIGEASGSSPEYPSKSWMDGKREIDIVGIELLMLELQYKTLVNRIEEIQKNCPHDKITVTVYNGKRVCDECEKEL